MGQLFPTEGVWMCQGEAAEIGAGGPAVPGGALKIRALCAHLGDLRAFSPVSGDKDGNWDLWAFHRGWARCSQRCFLGLSQRRGSAHSGKCHRVVMELLEFVASSRCLVALARVELGSPPMPQSWQCVCNIQPSAICGLGF